jgi:hypothetical protein
MIDRLFLDHPRSVGESYGEHAAVAARFGAALIVAGAACLVHAAIPALFPRTASGAIRRLYGEMRARQPGLAATAPAFASEVWQPEYEI